MSEIFHKNIIHPHMFLDLMFVLSLRHPRNDVSVSEIPIVIQFRDVNL